MRFSARGGKVRERIIVLTLRGHLILSTLFVIGVHASLGQVLQLRFQFSSPAAMAFFCLVFSDWYGMTLCGTGLPWALRVFVGARRHGYVGSKRQKTITVDAGW